MFRCGITKCMCDVGGQIEVLKIETLYIVRVWLMWFCLVLLVQGFMTDGLIIEASNHYNTIPTSVNTYFR